MKKSKKNKPGPHRIEGPMRKLLGMKERGSSKKIENPPHRLSFPAKSKKMSNGEYQFNKFNHFCESYLKHVSGEFAGLPFILEPWQKKIAKVIFSTLKKDGSRQYRKLLIHVGRRNGKSTFAAAFILFWLCEESFSDPAAEIYGASGDEKQAALIFRICQLMIRQSEELSQLLEVKPFYHRIANPLTMGVYEVLSSKVPTKPGRNSSLVIIDETWALPSGELYTLLETSMGSRKQPLMISLSSAGESTGSFYYELYDYSKRVEANPKMDPAFYPVIFEVEADKDPFDERFWKQANPGLGKYRSLEEMRELASRAKHAPAQEGVFRRHYLNQWVSLGIESWLPSLVWDGCGDPIDYPSLPQRRCFMGIDLSSSIDLAAVVLLFEPLEPGGRWDTFPFIWVPGTELTAKSREDHLAYDAWYAQGLIFWEGKPAIDFGSIAEKILELNKEFNLVGVGFDPWRAKDLIDFLRQQEGFEEKLVPIPQQFSFMSDATMEIQRKVHNRELRHGGHPVLRAMSENVKLVTDTKGNRMIDKKKSRTRIDGISGLCIAQSCATKFKSVSQGSVYDHRGILTLDLRPTGHLTSEDWNGLGIPPIRYVEDEPTEPHGDHPYCIRCIKQESGRKVFLIKKNEDLWDCPVCGLHHTRDDLKINP
jgi:phage terminase large subunit-like protein